MGTKPLPKVRKSEGLPPRNPIKLASLAEVRGEMARLYRLAVSGKLKSEELTRLIYALKEIRACIESELLDDVRMRLAAIAAGLGGPRHG